MFSFVIYLLLFLLLILLITVVHEFGHFIMAKLFNVYCYEFSIGMGPKLYSKQFKETLFSIRAFPIGGFVAMAGDDDDQYVSDLVIDNSRTLMGIAKYKRIIIMLAGIVMNFLLALVIYSLIICANGSYVKEAKPAIVSIMEDMPAHDSGLMVGDIITKIEFDNGAVIKPDTYSEISIFSQSYYDGNGMWHISVNRDNETFKYDIMPTYLTDEERYVIGISFSDKAVDVVETNIFNCFIYGFEYTLFIIKIVFDAFMTLFKGVGLEDLSGPVGMYSAVKQSVDVGIVYYIQIIAMISVNCAIFNALPLPIFDGGRIVLTIIEAIVGKPLDKKMQEYIMSACVVLLIMLMVFTTRNDIIRLFRG